MSVKKSDPGSGHSGKYFSDDFYVSPAWRKCREAYMQSVGMLCERCLKKGLIVPGDDVHHKIRLTPENISDPSVSLNFDNLECLCRDCHLKEHRKIQDRRWTVDEYGRVTLDDDHDQNEEPETARIEMISSEKI